MDENSIARSHLNGQGREKDDKPIKKELIEFKNGIKYEGEWVGAER